VNPSIIFIDLFLFLRTYACILYPFLSGKTESMSSRGSSTHQLERRKKHQHDVDVGEGGSRSHPPRRHSKRIVHRAYPRGHVRIETEIEEENPMDTSDDESAEDETYRMSLVPPSENSTEDEIERNDSGVRHEIEEEEERMVEGTLNPRSRRRAPFNPSPTICSPPKPLSNHVTSYKGKGATKQVKKLWKVNPGSQQRNAPNYRFHTQF
jgi:hypothetical protein